MDPEPSQPSHGWRSSRQCRFRLSTERGTSRESNGLITMWPTRFGSVHHDAHEPCHANRFGAVSSSLVAAPPFSFAPLCSLLPVLPSLRRPCRMDMPPGLLFVEGSGLLPSGQGGFSRRRDQVPSINEVVADARFLVLRARTGSELETHRVPPSDIRVVDMVDADKLIPFVRQFYSSPSTFLWVLVFCSIYASCVSRTLMVRKGRQSMGVPSGWIQVLPGPRPKSVQWPLAKDRLQTGPQEGVSRRWTTKSVKGGHQLAPGSVPIVHARWLTRKCPDSKKRWRRWEISKGQSWTF